MARHLLFCLLSFAIILSCDKNEPKENQQFKIKKQVVGYINDSTQVRDLKLIFKNDSIVNYNEDDSFVGGLNAIEIFETNGNPLLSIFPFEALDSTSTIDFIVIKDSRYKTEKDITILSPFEDIKNTYSITEIRNTLNSVEVIIDEIGASFVLNKNELLTTFDYGVEIDSTQLPKNSKFSSFIIHF